MRRIPVTVRIARDTAKGRLYGTPQWLLRRCGLKFASSVWISAALLATTSVARLYVPHQAPETTDVVVYLSMAIIFNLS
jgi:hypothetical protein